MSPLFFASVCHSQQTALLKQCHAPWHDHSSWLRPFPRHSILGSVDLQALAEPAVPSAWILMAGYETCCTSADSADKCNFTTTRSDSEGALPVEGFTKLPRLKLLQHMHWVSICLGARAQFTPDAVQIGSSTALAGLKLEVFVPRDDAPGSGAVATSVEMTPLCSPDVRPGRPSEAAQAR